MGQSASGIQPLTGEHFVLCFSDFSYTLVSSICFLNPSDGDLSRGLVLAIIQLSLDTRENMRDLGLSSSPH